MITKYWQYGTVLLNMPNLKKNANVVRDGTCIDATSPSHVITMGPMKGIPMWYELCATSWSQHAKFGAESVYNSPAESATFQ
jgi:hypothetical protein